MTKISIVVPMYNESLMVELYFSEVNKVLQTINNIEFEYIAVNDGSKDNTYELLHKCHKQYNNIVVVNLSRNFGHEAAVAAGLEVANGDAIIVMDADLQDPPIVIVDLIEKWQQGYKVVNAKRGDRKKDAFLKRFTAHKFYKIVNKYSGKIKIPENVGNYRLLDRMVIDYLNQLPEKNRVFRILVPYLGFKTTEVNFVREKRARGKTHYNYKSMFGLAINGITSSTTIPLKWTINVGLFALIFGMFGLCFVLILAIIKHFNPDFNQYINFEPGWASLMSVIIFASGVQLIFLGVIGTYIGQIFNEIKNRPTYYIDEILRKDSEV